MVLNAEGQDKIREKPVITQTREWWHEDKNGCNKQEEPQKTAPGMPPQKCNGVVGSAPYVSGTPCQNENWNAGDHVWRDQNGNEVRRSKA